MRIMYQKYIKRVLDSIIAFVFFIILLPLFGALSIMIYFEDKGNVFYNSERLGKNGRVFKMYKFRTMIPDAPDLRNEDGSTFNSEEDLRVTKIGKVLRKSSLDELPQVINVILGDMSLVGPRPDLPEHLNVYTQNEKRKLNVLPGITGYNQAYYRNSVSWNKRLENDIYYVDNISFLLDLKIFIATVLSVVQKKNIYVGEKSDS